MQLSKIQDKSRVQDKLNGPYQISGLVPCLVENAIKKICKGFEKKFSISLLLRIWVQVEPKISIKKELLLDETTSHVHAFEILFWSQAEAIEENVKISGWFNYFLTFCLFIVCCVITQVSIKNGQPAYTRESF